jgi:hypothetical protein
MKKTLILVLLFSVTISFGQTISSKNRLSSLKYSGTYFYGKGIEKGGIGTITVFPENDTTILFYLDLNRGVPSYNMGSLYGQVKIINDCGVFFKKFDSSGKSCKWNLVFSKNNLIIKTIDGQDNCGFGFAVNADGIFKRSSKKIIGYFEDMEKRKIYFKLTKPEDYYRGK